MNQLRVEYHRRFEKQLAKLPKKQRDKAIDAIELFLNNPAESRLRNHALVGQWKGYYSISAGGDLRIHLQLIKSENIVFFVAVGTHSQLYK